jgi:hypothetical protein
MDKKLVVLQGHSTNYNIPKLFGPALIGLTLGPNRNV